ncbi:hypothetical protein PAPYR_4690 [Paratrimastix pyriformis]|uniref:Uncharacterized protein n=1 Tax=Paratrimastix pyriformis TaxID=342808 RepID=A0ABQ8UJJ0_9EUKA|nr:hypothetical protein PAPYR_4690 [Paratrimastix pyriformis]
MEAGAEPADPILTIDCFADDGGESFLANWPRIPQKGMFDAGALALKDNRQAVHFLVHSHPDEDHVQSTKYVNSSALFAHRPMCEDANGFFEQAEKVFPHILGQRHGKISQNQFTAHDWPLFAPFEEKPLCPHGWSVDLFEPDFRTFHMAPKKGWNGACMVSVLKCEIGETPFQALFPGDATWELLNQYCHRDPALPHHYDIIKVPHHGSVLDQYNTLEQWQTLSADFYVVTSPNQAARGANKDSLLHLVELVSRIRSSVERSPHVRKPAVVFSTLSLKSSSPLRILHLCACLKDASADMVDICVGLQGTPVQFQVLNNNRVIMNPDTYQSLDTLMQTQRELLRPFYERLAANFLPLANSIIQPRATALALWTPADLNRMLIAEKPESDLLTLNLGTVALRESELSREELADPGRVVAWCKTVESDCARESALLTCVALANGDLMQTGRVADKPILDAVARLDFNPEMSPLPALRARLAQIADGVAHSLTAARSASSLVALLLLLAKTQKTRLLEESVLKVFSGIVVNRRMEAFAEPLSGVFSAMITVSPPAAGVDSIKAILLRHLQENLTINSAPWLVPLKDLALADLRSFKVLVPALLSHLSATREVFPLLLALCSDKVCRLAILNGWKEQLEGRPTIALLQSIAFLCTNSPTMRRAAVPAELREALRGTRHDDPALLETYASAVASLPPLKK